MISIRSSLEKRKGRGHGRQWNPVGSKLSAEGKREKGEEGKMRIGMGVGVKEGVGCLGGGRE